MLSALLAWLYSAADVIVAPVVPIVQWVVDLLPRETWRAIGRVLNLPIYILLCATSFASIVGNCLLIVVEAAQGKYSWSLAGTYIALFGTVFMMVFVAVVRAEETKRHDNR